ncbi:MAG: recombination mediator RecR [Firmicutes bacterium]|nr:recombination protein RecR [Alicyclobacillaceae bacterium]MCL6496034.1 recombination mediator RecR [Bacillota bacterium]
MYPASIQALIDQLGRLPGIGPKTAQRLAFFLLAEPPELSRALADAVVRARETVRYCSVCFNFTDIDPCQICRNPARDPKLVMVVEHPKDVIAMERTREYRGRYHVLHGTISPMEGIGPERLRVNELVDRVAREAVAELCIATGSSLEGEATALYLARLFQPRGVKVTRIARGIPMGGDLDYTDEATLLKAFEGRQEI